MPRALRRRVTFIAAAILLLATLHVITATGQPTTELQPGFNEALAVVRQAETAGVTVSELTDIVILLNRALELNEEALTLTGAGDAQRRAELLAQVDETLATVRTKASELTAVASQRTFTNKLIAYVSGVVAAVLGTLVYFYGGVFWRRYRVKRTFQMRISPK